MCVLGELITVFLVNLRNMLMSLHANLKTSLWNQLGIIV